MTIDSGRRRGWSAAAKARLVARALTPGVRVATLAQRHAVSTSRLYAWCRAARAAGEDGSRNRLVPVVVDDAVARGVTSSTPDGAIEIALAGDVRVVVRGTVEVSALRIVLAALRG